MCLKTKMKKDWSSPIQLYIGLKSRNLRFSYEMWNSVSTLKPGWKEVNIVFVLTYLDEDNERFQSRVVHELGSNDGDNSDSGVSMLKSFCFGHISSGGVVSPRGACTLKNKTKITWWCKLRKFRAEWSTFKVNTLSSIHKAKKFLGRYRWHLT